MAVARTRKEPRIGAFFDMDKTLIAENSGALLMKWRYERGELPSSELVSGLFAYLRYKVGFLDIRAWTRDAMQVFAGESERSLHREAKELFAERTEFFLVSFVMYDFDLFCFDGLSCL